MGLDTSQALVTENRDQSKSRGSKGRSKSTSKWQTKENFSCYHCGKEGHIKRNCKVFKRKQNDEKTQKNEKNQKKSDDKNTATRVCDEDAELIELFFKDDQCNIIADPYIEWIIDSGACYYATPMRDIFSEYRPRKIGRLKTGNTSYADIVGVGNVSVQTDLDCILKLKDVRYVPDLRLNLMFTHSLDLDCYHTLAIKNGSWTRVL